MIELLAWILVLGLVIFCLATIGTLVLLFVVGTLHIAKTTPAKKFVNEEAERELAKAEDEDEEDEAFGVPIDVLEPEGEN